MKHKLALFALLLASYGQIQAASTVPFSPLTFTDADPTVQNPAGLVEFHSIKGVLEVDMSATYDTNNPNGGTMPPNPYPGKEDSTFSRLAYSCKYTNSTAAPTVSYAGPLLRVFPGDRIIIHFKNGLFTQRTNLHFHGMAVTPKIGTADGKDFGDYVGLPFVNQIDPGTEREYNFLVPVEQRPGLFWYHAHAHGVAENQVGCGLGGPIYIEGVVSQFLANWSAKVKSVAAPGVADKLIPAVSAAMPNLVQHILVLKDYEDPSGPIVGPFEQSINGKVTYTTKTKKGTPYWITSDGSPQIWSISNQSADMYYLLRFSTTGGVSQPFEVIARDGGPDDFTGPGMGAEETQLMIPPASRVSVVAPTDKLGTGIGYVIASPVNSGLGGAAKYAGDAGNQYFQPVKAGVTNPGARSTPWKLIEVHSLPGATSAKAVSMPSLLNFPLSNTATAAAVAKVPHVDASYVFSEPGFYEGFNPDASKLAPYESSRNLTFYKYVSPADYTKEIKNPLDIYNPDEPAIATLVPGVPQRWIIQNSSQEWHIFHIHQIQFQVENFTLVNYPYNAAADPLTNLTRPSHNYQHPFYSDDFPPPAGLQNGDPDFAGGQDTVAIPPMMQVWIYLPMTEGTHKDDPIAGHFVMHCHILGHEDAGMMANVEATRANGVAEVTDTRKTSFIHSLPPMEIAQVKTDRPLHLEDTAGHMETAKVFSKSEYSMVTFGFTHCDGACPFTVEKCLGALSKLSPAEQARITPYFVSLDPKRDDASALTAYAKEHAMPSSWNVLVDTDLAGIRAFGVKREIKTTPEGQSQIWHSSTVYVIDRNLKIRAAFDPENSSEVMTDSLKKLLSGTTKEEAKPQVTDKKAPSRIMTGVELTMGN